MKQRVFVLTMMLMLVFGVENVVAQQSEDDMLPIPHKVPNLELKKLDGETTMLPFYGQKHILIFYVDPDKHRQNEDFTFEIEENHCAAGENIEGFGILNLKDTKFPNSIVKMLARKRTAKNGATVIADEDNIVAKQWGLGDCNNKFVLLLVSRDGELVFCRKGEFSEQDKKDFYEIIAKYR